MVEEYISDLDDLIEIVPGKGAGKAYIKESGIAVNDVLSMLTEGMDNKEILNYFPSLEEDHILACLAHDANNGLVRE
ncbi:MAG: DUF433 domain-containing protein [Sulfurimonadaceae bacterium]